MVAVACKVSVLMQQKSCWEVAGGLPALLTLYRHLPPCPVEWMCVFTNGVFDRTTNYLLLLVYIKNSQVSINLYSCTTVYVVPDLWKQLESMCYMKVCYVRLRKVNVSQLVWFKPTMFHPVHFICNCHVAILYIALPMEVSTIEAQLAWIPEEESSRSSCSWHLTYRAMHLLHV